MKGIAVFRMLIIGPPGSGKGTQAERISQRLGMPAISTGEIFRQNIASMSPLGIECKQYIDSGEFVPDQLTNRMVRDRLRYPDMSRGFLLDGYPRTSAQVAELDDVLAQENLHLNVALQLTAEDDELVKRLFKRAKVNARSDDTEPVIRHRLDLYREQTAPILAIYAQRGILVRVNGNGGIDEVTDKVMTQIAKMANQPTTK